MSTPMRILVPVDLSEGAKAVYAYAVFIGERFGATVDVLHVVEPSKHLEPTLALMTVGGVRQTLAELERSTAGQAMERFLEKLERSPLVKTKSTMATGEVVETVLRMATREKYDLVVMGSRGRTNLMRLAEGGKAERVARLAPCPVIVMPG